MFKAKKDLNLAKSVNEWLYNSRARALKQVTLVTHGLEVVGDEGFDLDYVNNDDLRSLDSDSD